MPKAGPLFGVKISRLEAEAPGDRGKVLVVRPTRRVASTGGVTEAGIVVNSIA